MHSPNIILLLWLNVFAACVNALMFDTCSMNHMCQNGATCVDGVEGYSCQCTDSYKGEFCTEDVDECLVYAGLCQNGGTCYNTHGSFGCSCIYGFEGTYCETNFNDCHSSPCLNGGICEDRISKFYCHCKPGFIGLLCHIDDPCAPNPCKFNSRCYPDPVEGTYICSCSKGYRGPNCSEDIDECSEGIRSPCDFGTCRNLNGSYECLCPVGRTGRWCESNINECASNPCSNGATCLDYVGEFKCLCMPNWTGQFCDIPLLTCDSQLCLNNGHCVDTADSYRCECPLGFAGRICELQTSTSTSGLHCDETAINECEVNAKNPESVPNWMIWFFACLLAGLLVLILFQVLIRKRKISAAVWTPDVVHGKLSSSSCSQSSNMYSEVTLERSASVRPQKSWMHSHLDAAMGRNVNTCGSDESALHLAIRHLVCRDVRILLEAGADPNLPNCHGDTALHIAVRSCGLEILKLILHSNTNVDKDAENDEGMTPLLVAAYALTDQLALTAMRYLIEAGATVDKVDMNGRTALHWAASVNNVQCIQYLIENELNKDSQDLKGETPCFVAAREGNIASLQTLLYAGCCTGIPDNMDRVAVKVAEANGHLKCVQLINEVPDRFSVIEVAEEQESQRTKSLKENKIRCLKDSHLAIRRELENTRTYLKDHNPMYSSGYQQSFKEMQQPVCVQKRHSPPPYLQPHDSQTHIQAETLGQPPPLQIMSSSYASTSFDFSHNQNYSRSTMNAMISPPQSGTLSPPQSSSFSNSPQCISVASPPPHGGSPAGIYEPTSSECMVSVHQTAFVSAHQQNPSQTMPVYISDHSPVYSSWYQDQHRQQSFKEMQQPVCVQKRHSPPPYLQPHDSQTHIQAETLGQPPPLQIMSSSYASTSFDFSHNQNYSRSTMNAMISPPQSGTLSPPQSSSFSNSPQCISVASPPPHGGSPAGIYEPTSSECMVSVHQAFNTVYLASTSSDFLA